MVSLSALLSFTENRLHAVGLVVAAVGRGEGVALLVATWAETEVKPCIEELASEGRTATEAVDGPALRRTKFLLEAQQMVEGADTVDGDGFAILFAQLHLSLEDTKLYIERSRRAIGAVALYTIDATLAKLHDLREREEPMQSFDVALKAEVGLSRPPRMDAYSIEGSIIGPWQTAVGVDPLISRKQHLLGQTDNACSRRCGETMGVEIHANE